MKSVSEEIASWAADFKFESLPAPLTQLIKTALIDYTGVCVAGASSQVASAARVYAASMSGASEAVIFGARERFCAPFAAFANAVSAHALDFDDVSFTTIGHPSVTLAPVCFALAQKSALSGRDVILAYALGAEAMHKIASLCMPRLSERGWHTTSALGVLGACVAACSCMRLSAEQTANALGLAASRASGVRANFGTGAKAYHAGMACFGGMEAAALAKAGVSASRAAFEGAEGFFDVLADGASSNLNNNEICDYSNLKLGEPWDLLENGLAFKRYPCCSGAHPAADLAGELADALAARGLGAKDVERVSVGCSLLAPKELNVAFAQNGVEAKFCMRYAIAARLVYGSLGLDEFADERVQNSRIQDFMRKIDVAVDSEFAKLGFIGTSPARIALTLKNGETLSGVKTLAKGTPQNPLSKEQIKEKFLSCARALPRAKELYAALCALEEHDKIDFSPFQI